ncbi:hypothetical protein ACJ72_08576 [Emergomyces africanus]|uniref:Uncharacterized protein n=1 Tax=Emergomyces africanus TaxID=1955775 RepID=A0A1B7NJX1_9EURO|nr:hypothetical protein ACJ72_08576 [Emergomyces africanus]
MQSLEAPIPVGGQGVRSVILRFCERAKFRAASLASMHIPHGAHDISTSGASPRWYLLGLLRDIIPSMIPWSAYDLATETMW